MFIGQPQSERELAWTSRLQEATKTRAGNGSWTAPPRDLYGTLNPAKRRAGASLPCLPVRIKSCLGSLRAEHSSGAKRPCLCLLIGTRTPRPLVRIKSLPGGSGAKPLISPRLARRALSPLAARRFLHLTH